MTQRITLQTMSGAVLAISAALPATYDAAGYGATGFTFTTIGEIENFGDHGATAAVSSFTPVNTGVTEKLKGAIDYGTMNVVLGNLPSDAGQAIIDTAVASTSRYSAKISYPPGAGESTGEIHYLDVLVTKRVWQDGAIGDIRKIAVDLAVCRKPVVVAGS